MTAPRRGMDVITLIRLKTAVTALQEELHDHKQICSQCTINANTPHKACDEGWRIHRELARAGNSLAVYVGVIPKPKAQEQEALF